MGECAWTRDICKEMEAQGAFIMVNAGSVFSRDNPDRAIIHTLWHGFIEFKAEATPIKVGQGVKIREINKRTPGMAVIVRKPNQIELPIPEDCRHSAIVAYFDGTGKGLLEQLKALKASYDTNL